MGGRKHIKITNKYDNCIKNKLILFKKFLKNDQYLTFNNYETLRTFQLTINTNFPHFSREFQ